MDGKDFRCGGTKERARDFFGLDGNTKTGTKGGKIRREMFRRNEFAKRYAASTISSSSLQMCGSHGPADEKGKDKTTTASPACVCAGESAICRRPRFLCFLPLVKN